MATKTPAKKAPAKKPAPKAPPKKGRVLKFDNPREAILAATKHYASQAEAARQTKVAKSYLSRLLHPATRETPGDLTLSRLGITRTVTYTVAQ